MKTKTLLLAVLIAMGTMSLAYGKEHPDMAVVSLKGSEVFKVIYKGNTSGKVRLNVFDWQGKLIHSGSIAGRDGFICPLNFKGLPSGNYTIELVDDQGSHREEVSYLPAHEMKRIHMSRIRSADAKFLFAVSNASNETLRIRIYDSYQRLLFTEDKVIDGDFAQVYKIASPLNQYTFEVSDLAGNKKYFTF